MKLGQIASCTLTVLTVLAMLLAGSTAEAGTLYYTSMNFGDATFARYDAALDSWQDLAPYDTQTQMASSSEGRLYAYDGQRNMIQLYRSDSDTWDDFMQGPGIPNTWGNLEITREGRFLYTAFGGGHLYYSDGDGDWSSLAIPFDSAMIGDYDPHSNRYVVGEQYTGRIHAIDVESFEITSYASTGWASEVRRMGSILGESFYENSGSGGVRVWDLSDPEGRPERIAQPLRTAWMASAVDREQGILYTVDLLRGSFYALGDDGFSQLASAPAVVNHSSLVYVAHAPEPDTALLLLLGLCGLALSGRRGRVTRLV